MMLPPRPGETVTHNEDATPREVVYFNPIGLVGTREGTLPWHECTVTLRLSDQEIFDRAHEIELEGYPVRHFHPEVFMWDRRRTLPSAEPQETP